MKTIKLYIMAAVALATGLFAACTDYQDEVDALDTRVTILENLVQRVNSDIAALQTVISAVENGDVITDLKPYTSPNGTPGYQISFLNHDPITVLNGEKGEKGQDAVTPEFTLEKDPSNPADDNYYWKLNGEWVTDPTTGDKLIAVGKDGKNGKDGEDGVTPQLKIIDNVWYVSYDKDHKVWEPLKDANEQPIVAKGKDGEDAKSNFKSVGVFTDETTNEITHVVFVLNNGQSFTVNMLVYASELVIYKGSNPAAETEEVNSGSLFELSAVVRPDEALYKDVFWYVKQGDISKVSIFKPEQATTYFQIDAAGLYVIRVVARYSQPGKPLVYQDCRIVVK